MRMKDWLMDQPQDEPTNENELMGGSPSLNWWLGNQDRYPFRKVWIEQIQVEQWETSSEPR